MQSSTLSGKTLTKKCLKGHLGNEQSLYSSVTKAPTSHSHKGEVIALSTYYIKRTPLHPRILGGHWPFYPLVLVSPYRVTCI